MGVFIGSGFFQNFHFSGKIGPEKILLVFMQNLRIAENSGGKQKNK
jgi:hypothetical protein